MGDMDTYKERFIYFIEKEVNRARCANCKGVILDEVARPLCRALPRTHYPAECPNEESKSPEYYWFLAKQGKALSGDEFDEYIDLLRSYVPIDELGVFVSIQLPAVHHFHVSDAMKRYLGLLFLALKTNVPGIWVWSLWFTLLRSNDEDAFKRSVIDLNNKQIHDVWDEWFMNDMEYTSLVQWLPRELIEDIVMLTPRRSSPETRI